MTAKCIVKWKGKNLHNTNIFYNTVKILYVYFIYFISMEKGYCIGYMGGGGGGGISTWKQILGYFFGNHNLYIGK